MLETTERATSRTEFQSLTLCINPLMSIPEKGSLTGFWETEEPRQSRFLTKDQPVFEMRFQKSPKKLPQPSTIPSNKPNAATTRFLND